MAEPIPLDKSKAADAGVEAEADKAELLQRYSGDEVAEIIRLSLMDQAARDDDSIDHQELLSIGREFGVDEQGIARAIGLLEDERRAKDKEEALWLEFKAHCFMFVGVSLFCLVLNIFTGIASLWSGYVFFGWGLFVFGHYVGLRYAPDMVALVTKSAVDMANEKRQELFEDTGNVLFSIPDPSGMRDTRGMVSIDAGKLVLEYQSRDALLGLVKTGVKEVVLSPQDILQLRLAKRTWSSELVVKARNMKVLNRLPGASADTLRLKIDRNSQAAAKQLVAEFEACRAQPPQE